MSAEVVVAALRTQAEQHAGAAAKLGGRLAAARRSGKDIRSGAVKIVDLLADAETMRQVADDLEQGTLVLASAAAAALAPDQPSALEVPGPPEETANLADEHPDTGQADEGSDDDDELISERDAADAFASLRAEDPDA